ncbi:hypothetical protein HB364_23970 [Pseudoflavitalea sp. X16]|uniref:DUF6088 family protein n=1 Tax=Paraflavitalea devenefica TaxID=2716334 RepID=UPI00141FD010|nr:DUF6088 family protein [Paraflavitalea devenefica]NII28161.1 hypothetical protein [Paraflavitalea devenefica]
MNNNKTIESRILSRIARKKSNILLREDFIDLGGYDQVGRALLQLIRKGRIVKIGYGLYAKAKISSLTGETLPVEPLPILAREAMKRLGIKVSPTKAEIDYQAGRSTQVPTGRLIGVSNRISRKIGYKGASVYYERAS